MSAKTVLIVGVVLCVPAYFFAFHFGKDEKPATSPEAKKENPSSVASSVPVVAMPVEKRAFREAIKVHGSLKSRNFSLVSPRIKGVLEEVCVREGDEVVAGKTKLFQTDSVKLLKSVEMNRQLLNVARCAREVQEAYREKTNAELRKAEMDFKRNKALYEQRAVSQDVLDDKRSIYEQLLAMQKYAISQVALAREEEQRAQVSLSMSEKDLDRKSVV